MKQGGSKFRIFTAMLTAFGITGLYFVFVYQKLPFIYEINDDVAMRNVAAGVITGMPDAHLIHIKYILGLFISGMYKMLPGFDWYGLTLIGIMLFSFSMILYRGFVAEKGLVWKGCYTILALLLFTCTGLQHLTAFQWTVTAAMAGAAGIYLFYTAETSDRFQMILEEGLAVFLILVTLLIRDDVFLMVLPVAAVCFWWKYGSFHREKKLPIVLKHAAVPAGLLAGVALILGVEAFAYRSPEWKEFLAYNLDREAIMDFYGQANYEDDAEFYDSLSITPEEAENLQRYSLYLTEDLYSEKMDALAERSRELYLQQHPAKERLGTAFQKIYEHLGKAEYQPLNLICLLAAAMVFGICYEKNRRQWYLVCSVLGIAAMYWLYLGYRNRIVERVGAALYFLILLSLLGVWYRTVFLEEPVKNGKQGFCAAGALTVGIVGALLLLSANITWKAVESNNTARRDYNLEFLDVNRYMAEHMENVYFMTTFSIETYTDNFTVRRDFAFSNLLSVGGWHTFSPLENVKNAKLGISDPKKDIAEKENVYLISLEDVNLRYMDRYYKSLYGEKYLGRELVDALNYGERVFEVYDVWVE